MYKILKMEGRAKRAHMETVHGNIETPVFMNVGTAAAIKGAVSTEDLQQIGEVVKKMGGLHKFMVWDKPILTDSGGFQVFSLAGLRKIKEEGVYFHSHVDGRKIFMGPEESMQIQSNLGSTIAMAFDECVENPATYEYAKASCERTLRWLEARACRFADEALTGLYNLNLFFCIFFSTGVTLDSEELVLVTSRSPRYYVSAAYWDRDSLLWSFPAVLDADPALARRMLEYAFGRQRRNFGVHSRLIDGTVLEPGFELDELMAPVLALERYTDATGDRSLLEEGDVKKGVRSVLEKLAQRRHPDLALYSTFLQPTDDERVYPYLTYDNVLVWRALRALARLYPEHGGLAERAAAVREAIRTHCVKTRDQKPYYAWSVDLEGHWDVYDEPPGSLLLLPWLGFCEQDDETWHNTVGMICAPEYAYSFAGHPIPMIGCPHAPHPWLLSIANSLLCGRRDKCLEILRDIRMDNGIACESVHEDTGECTTGEAFATCAGFLCHAIKAAFAGEKGE